MRIFLTGFRGAGKTGVGEILARRLGVPFVDLDRHIELRAGMTVREIFAAQGEPAFRRLETEALRAEPDAVIATGGGAPVYEWNAQLLRASGISVFLNPSFAALAGRIGGTGKQ